MFNKPSNSRHLKPERLRPAENVLWSELSSTAPSFIRPPRTKRGKLGVQYERRVHLHLAASLSVTQLYLPGPWVRFICANEQKSRWCQPDGLLFDFATGLLTVVEMKYSHTADSWWWMQKLYLPVIRSLFPASLWTYRRCEIVHSYDPGVRFPEPTVRVKRLEELSPKQFGVMILKEMCYE